MKALEQENQSDFFVDGGQFIDILIRQFLKCHILFEYENSNSVSFDSFFYQILDS